MQAYGRCRILLHHLARGGESDAATVYAGMKENVSANSAGYPYVELADVLWTAYQTDADLDSACPTVVDYVSAHPELLEPLGTGGEFDHGLQSHDYSPEDLCPFPISD